MKYILFIFELIKKMTFGIVLYLTQIRKRDRIVPYTKTRVIKTKVLKSMIVKNKYKVLLPVRNKYNKYNSKKELYL